MPSSSAALSAIRAGKMRTTFSPAGGTRSAQRLQLVHHVAHRHRRGALQALQEAHAALLDEHLGVLLAEFLELALQVLAALAHAVDEARLQQDVEHRVGDAGGQRIAAIGRAVRARDHADRRLLGRHEGADREAAAHALGDRRDIGLHARPVVAPQLAGAAETRVDLVVEQQQAELVADRAQVLQELRGRGADAAFALDRLDQDAGGLVVDHVAHDVGVVQRRVAIAGRRRAEAFEVLLVAGGGERVQQAAVERRLEGR